METDSQQRLSDTGVQHTGEQLSACAYVVVIPRIEGPVFDTLQKLIAALSLQQTAVLPLSSPRTQLEVVDSWLEHTAAAEYLGISKSTLYRYAERGHIESRKLGNRLEYRRSSLDKFKDQHVRPPRRLPRGRGIIAPALSSGN